MIPELSRPVPLERIGDGMTVTVEADAAECAAIATRLMVPSVESLRCDWTLSAPVNGIVVATGALLARLHQECVVSLETFPAVVGERFTVTFVPRGEEDEAADDPDAPDELPYDGASLDLGEASVEQVALLLEPYPRKPGAQLPEDAAEAPGSPFDALARWRTPE